MADIQDKPVALVLGGTVPHRQLIKQLQQRGYYVILVDFLASSPAKEAADEHIQESTLDCQAVLRVAQERNAALVIAAAVDQANITCCYVAEKLGLPHPYSYETALDVTHKDRMKRIMVEGGVPTSPYVEATDLENFEAAGVTYPCMVKPTNNNGSKGVRVAHDQEERDRYLVLAQQASRTGDALVETFVEGVEVSSYYYVQAGKAYALATCQKGGYIEGMKDAVRQYASVVYPANISADAQVNLNDAAQKVAAAFGLVNTPLFLQAIVKPDSTVSVIEFAPRLGGGLCFRSIPLLTGFDYLDGAICSFLGQDAPVETIHPNGKLLVIGNMFAKAGVLGSVAGAHELVEQGVVDEFFQVKQAGAEIGSDGSTSSRFAQFICIAPTGLEVGERAMRAHEEIIPYDAGGNSLKL